jgi:fucose 4-O-acetylase-like acetyltransferase
MASLLSKSDFISKKIAYIGSGSLYILIFHIIFQFKALNAMSRISSNSFINSFVALAFGVLLPLIFLEISRRNKVLAWLLLPSKLHRPFKICWRGISKS